MLALFAVILVAAQLAVPRRWFVLPLLLAACHTPAIPLFSSFTVARLVIAAAILRAAASGWLVWNPREPMDRAVAAFGMITIASTVGYSDLVGALVYRSGLVYNIGGTYLIARATIKGLDDFRDFCRAFALTLVPLAVLMAWQNVTLWNPYSVFGAYEGTVIRNGRPRASGPFGTPILAGTAGASSVVLFIVLWKHYRKWAAIGLGSALLVTLTSASSGPIGTVVLGIGAVVLWRWRQYLNYIRVSFLLLIPVMALIKERPIWYIVALLDFVGGSTGWHRAYLIDITMQHLGEWWLFGTDDTSGWIWYQDPDSQADITNYYLHLGIIGGLPLLFSLIFVLWRSFQHVGWRVRSLEVAEPTQAFFHWCLGAALFAHAISFLSISYFDQTYVLFWLLIGALPGVGPALSESFASSPVGTASTEAAPSVGS